MTRIETNDTIEENLKQLLTGNDDFRYILKIWATDELTLMGCAEEMNHILIPTRFIQEITNINVLDIIHKLHDNTDEGKKIEKNYPVEELILE